MHTIHEICPKIRLTREFGPNWKSVFDQIQKVGKPIRDAIGGGQVLIPSNVKIGAASAEIDVNLGHKDDAWAFDQIDTVSVMVPGAPRPDEIIVIVALADGGRPRPRVSKTGAVPPKRAGA